MMMEREMEVMLVAEMEMTQWQQRNNRDNGGSTRDDDRDSNGGK